LSFFTFSPFLLYLPQDAVHHPVDARGADAVHGAGAALLQVLHDVADEGELDVLGVLGQKLLPAANNLKTYGQWQLLEVKDVDRLEEEILKVI